MSRTNQDRNKLSHEDYDVSQVGNGRPSNKAASGGYGQASLDRTAPSGGNHVSTNGAAPSRGNQGSANRMFVMYTGEIKRMKRYGITGASLFVAAIWIMILQFSDVSDISFTFPLTLFMDATLMSLLLAGVTMIFEKQENTFRSMMVLPITGDDYLLSKSMTIVTSSLTTLVLLLAYGIGFKSLEISIIGITGAVILVAFSFAQVGIVMTYYSEDFTDLLMNMLKFTIVLAIPTILEMVNILDVSWFKTVQYLNPTKNALVVLQASVIPIDRKDLTIAVIYLTAMSVGLYVISRKLLDSYVAKEGA